MTRVVLILMDGLADRRWPALGGKTPLEAAQTPNLDKLASSGLTGLMHPLGRGLAPSSELAHFALFGYPLDAYPGRGVFEALGNDLPVDDGDVVLHGICASVVRDGSRLKLVERIVSAPDDVCRELVGSIGTFVYEGLEIKAVFTRNSQAIIYIQGGAAKEITDSDPYYVGRPVSAVLPVKISGSRMDIDDIETARRTARALSGFLIQTYRALDNHPINEQRRAAGVNPINFLLTKWPGMKRSLKTFKEQNGFEAASVCSYPVYRGLVKSLGMRVIDIPYGDEPGDDLLERLRAAERALDEGMDFVHVHTKAPDDAGHEKDPVLKKEVIEKIDKACGYLFDSRLIADDVLLVVTADHATPSGTDLIHSGDPVPLLMVGESAWRDSVGQFGETACVSGGLGQLTGFDFMPTILNYSNRIRYLGSTLTPEPTIYEPQEVEPLEL